MSLLPRRGYEPVDDGDDDETTHESNNSRRAAGAPNITITPTSTEGDVDDAKSSSDKEGSGGEEDGRITVRVLDVRGQFYPLRVHPETTVRELKQSLVGAAGVEYGRQRIIYGGKMLGDADTLASRKITDGAAVHLFQRPKTAVTAAAGGAAGVVSTAQQPGRLHEFPPVLLQVHGARAGGGAGAAGYVNAHWEVDRPRKQIRLLASCLLIISVVQLLECLASVSAALSYSGAAGKGGDSGGGGGGAYAELPDEYWVLVKGRSLSSLMGIVVGMLGIRGSQSLNTQTIKMYFAGLVLCAIVAMVIRIEVFIDIITGKIPFGDYGMGSRTSSDDYAGDGGDPQGGGSEAGAGGPGGEGANHETAEEAQSSLFFTAFSAFISVVVSGGVWLLCIRRVNANRSQISEHMASWDRRETGEELGRSIDPTSDGESERGPRETGSV